MSPPKADRVLLHAVMGCNLISEFYSLVFGPWVHLGAKEMPRRVKCRDNDGLSKAERFPFGGVSGIV